MGFYFKYVQRQFSHARFLFLLIIVLNTLDTKDHITRQQIVHRKHFERDLKYCQNCFQYQIQHCSKFFEQIQADEGVSLRQLLTFFPEVLRKRDYHLIRLKNSNEKLIAKNLFKRTKLGQVSSEIDLLRGEFLQQQENMQGLQYAPVETIDNFIKNLQIIHINSSDILIWNYLLNNIQPLIFPMLYERGFPVPKTYAVCGFSIYQQYAGGDLFNFFKTSFITKLEIAKQLLEAAIKFSHGFDNYRLYISDLTADNIVYNKADKQIYFIDLDTIFIVDSSQAKHKTLIHKHTYVECSGCFAYSADDIASYNISDVNVYLVCQFLTEDLYRDQSKGFLHRMPDEFTNENTKLWLLLTNCVDCPDSSCLERFTVAKELIVTIDEILSLDTTDK